MTLIQARILRIPPSQQIFPVAALGLTSWEAVVGGVEDYLGENLLLHAAVSSGSVSMVTLILDLHDCFRYATFSSFCDTLDLICTSALAVFQSHLTGNPLFVVISHDRKSKLSEAVVGRMAAFFPCKRKTG